MVLCRVFPLYRRGGSRNETLQLVRVQSPRTGYSVAICVMPYTVVLPVMAHGVEEWVRIHRDDTRGSHRSHCGHGVVRPCGGGFPQLPIKGHHNGVPLENT